MIRTTKLGHKRVRPFREGPEPMPMSADEKKRAAVRVKMREMLEQARKRGATKTLAMGTVNGEMVSVQSPQRIGEPGDFDQ
jgi:hypothetical protein